MRLNSLAFKWTVTLVVTSLIGVILVGLVASRTTITAYDRLRSDQAAIFFVEQASTYFQTTGDWGGVEFWLREVNDFQDSRRGSFRNPQQFALIDNNGRVVAGFGSFQTGEVVPTNLIEQGTPILLDGVSIGTAVLAQPPPELDPRERLYVEGINRALWIGALGAGSTALIIGLLLSRQFLRPLAELTQAITAMHAGALEQRVEIRTRDELGILARTFNEMSANLYRANQLRKQMTADIAHDLRTPLTVIAGYLEALGDGTLKATPERFRIMGEEVTLLQRLVEDLRTLSLVDAGELKLMRSAYPARDLLERVATSFQGQAEASRLHLVVEVADHLPDLWIDSERMVLVLGNLIANALRYSPADGRILLCADRAPDAASSIRIQVFDTGSGILPEDLSKIFDRFYRVDTSRHTNAAESGLGLAIAKSIVEAHGGSISAESIMGRGTTITLILPIAPAKA